MKNKHAEDGGPLEKNEEEWKWHGQTKLQLVGIAIIAVGVLLLIIYLLG